MTIKVGGAAILYWDNIDWWLVAVLLIEQLQTQAHRSVIAHDVGSYLPAFPSEIMEEFICFSMPGLSPPAHWYTVQLPTL